MKKFLIYSFIIGISFLNVNFAFADIVVFNTKTKKIHSLNCKQAKKCTVNCVKIERKIARQKGGEPCKICGGS